MSNQTVSVDLAVTGVDEATAKFERLAQAIERASAAIAKLDGSGSHNITINIVGDLMNVSVSPRPDSAIHCA